MRSQKQGKWVFALILIVLVAGWYLAEKPEAAWACTPPPGGLPEYSIADRVGLAPIVLEGEVVEVADDPLGSSKQIAVVNVSRYYKGSGPAQVAITNFGSPALCLSPIGVGVTQIFFVAGDTRTGFSAFYASQFDAYTDASEDNQAAVIEAVGQQPAAPDPDLPPLVGPLETGTAIAAILPQRQGTPGDGPPLDSTSVPPPVLTMTAEATAGGGAARPGLPPGVGTTEPGSAGTPGSLPDAPPPVLTETAAALPTVEPGVAGTVVDTLAPTPTPAPGATSEPGEEDNNVTPFVLGFLAATVVYGVLALGYWWYMRQEV